MNPNEDINPNAEEIKNLEAQIAQIDVTTLDPSDNGKVRQTDAEVKVEEQTSKPETATENLIKEELERVKGQTQGKTPQEKFEYKLKRELAQAKEMGIDIASLTGYKPEQQDTDEDKPLTKKDLEEILRNSQQRKSKTAVEMAFDIENEAERELHLFYLENKVNPSLSEEEKFNTAKDMVEGIKLKNQMTLSTIKPEVKNHSTASSVQPLKEQTFDAHKLTPEEELFFRDAKIRGVPLTKEEIVKMRN